MLPPVNIKKIETSSPVKTKFRLIPKYDRSLESYVESVDWDCVSKTLKIMIRETAKFSAFAWFGTINDRQLEMQRAAFSDMEQDTLMLMFLDDGDRSVALFKFKELKLVGHELSLDKALLNIDNTVVHQIRIHYNSFTKIEKKEEIDPSKDLGQDEEWMTIEVNAV